jgi:DNA polymerase elongation subunit (family B)
MSIVERLAQWAENDMRAEGVALDAKYEIERLQEYERLVKFIANDYHELSHEKTQWQRDDWKKRCIALQQKESE